MATSIIEGTRHPYEIVENPALAPSAKRAILASWASDAFTVDSRPDLRKPPELSAPTPIDDVIAALKLLDRQEANHRLPARSHSHPFYTARREASAT